MRTRGSRILRRDSHRDGREAERRDAGEQRRPAFVEPLAPPRVVQAAAGYEVIAPSGVVLRDIADAAHQALSRLTW